MNMEEFKRTREDCTGYFFLFEKAATFFFFLIYLACTKLLCVVSGSK